MKIPPQAKKVFSGEVFDVYQWPQKLYDDSVVTFEMIKRPYTVLVISATKNKIILSRESQPMKSLSVQPFGGRIEKNETPLHAAKRELLEESGLTSNDWMLYRTFEFSGKIDWNIYTFIARDCKKVAEPKLDAGENIESIEVNFDEFVRILADETRHEIDLSNYIYRLRSENRLDELRALIFPKK